MDNFTNWAEFTVSQGYDAAATSVALSADPGAACPTAPANGWWWNATDYPRPQDDPNHEIVRMTGRASATLTITRAQEGTSASAKNTAGKTYKIAFGPTAKTFNTDIPADIAAVAARFPVATSDLGNNAADNTKLADMANHTVKARDTAGAGDPEDKTISAVLDWISATQGTVLYRGAGGWAALAPGTSGQVLQTNGAAANPSWATAAGGGGGDFSSNTTVSVDGELVLFSGTLGKTGKRCTLTGILKATSGVAAAAIQGTDYYAPGGTKVAIADGGTGAGSANAALDALITAEANVASATTTDLGAQTSQNLQITGTTTITSFGTVAAGVKRWCRLAGALTLTHNGTSLILPGAANIATAAGDRFLATSLGSGNWLVNVYVRASGQQLVETGFFEFALSDETTAIATGTAVVTWRAPFACTITGVRSSVAVVSSSGLPTADIKKNGTTIFSTLLSIDANEKTSVTAATPAVLSATSMADDDEITFDITVAGTGAKGLKVKIYYSK